MLLGTLAVSILENALAEKIVPRAGESTTRASENLMSPHALTNFEIKGIYNKS